MNTHHESWFKIRLTLLVSHNGGASKRVGARDLESILRKLTSLGRYTLSSISSRINKKNKAFSTGRRARACTRTTNIDKTTIESFVSCWFCLFRWLSFNVDFFGCCCFYFHVLNFCLQLPTICMCKTYGSYMRSEYTKRAEERARHFIEANHVPHKIFSNVSTRSHTNPPSPMEHGKSQTQAHTHTLMRFASIL